MNPRTPRQEEAWILSGRRWPTWTKPTEDALVQEPAPATAMIDGPHHSACLLAELHRTPEQILADEQELAARKAAKPPKHERGRDRRQRRLQREAQRAGRWTP